VSKDDLEQPVTGLFKDQTGAVAIQNAEILLPLRTALLLCKWPKKYPYILKRLLSEFWAQTRFSLPLSYSSGQQ
jgi:hypothetical protein